MTSKTQPNHDENIITIKTPTGTVFVSFPQTSAADPPATGENAGEGVRVAGVGGGRPRHGLPLREGRRVPAHPRRLLPRHQAPGTPQAAPARRVHHLRRRQCHPRRVEEDPAPHRGRGPVQEPGVQGPVRAGRAGARLYRAVAADGGAELQRPQLRPALQPVLPAPRHAARRRSAAAGRRDAPGTPAARGADGGDAAAVREEPEGSGQDAQHLRAAAVRDGVPGRRQIHARRPVAPAQRRRHRVGPAVRGPHRVARERQQVVVQGLQPLVLEEGQRAAAPAVGGGAVLMMIPRSNKRGCGGESRSEIVARFRLLPVWIFPIVRSE